MRVRPEDVMFATFGESMIHVTEVRSLDDLVEYLRARFSDDRYEPVTRENVGFKYRGRDDREGWESSTWAVTIAGKPACLSDSDRF